MDTVCGIHAVLSRLQRSPEKARRLVVAKTRRDRRAREVISLARDAGVRVVRVDEPTLNRLSDGSKHQGVVLECHAFAPESEVSLEERWNEFVEPFVVVLDGILDPRNFGAALRTAAAAGADVVLYPKSRSAPISTVVHKASSGALEEVLLVQVSNLARRLRWLRENGVWIVGAASGATLSYEDAKFSRPLCVVVGGEEKGMRRLTREACDEVVSIPMEGSVESLNVSVALGILLFEARRRWTD